MNFIFQPAVVEFAAATHIQDINPVPQLGFPAPHATGKEDYWCLVAASFLTWDAVQDCSYVGPGMQVDVMALTFVEGVVTGKKKKKATVEFLIDSGAVYALLPEKDWKAIGLKPKRRMTFTLADGTKVERAISECHISLPQGDGHTPVILGEADNEPLLGAVTLEILGLVLNPFKRSLQPMRAMLA